MCAKGYPGSYKKNIPIKNIFKVKQTKTTFIYHAGTYFSGKIVRSIGGRILNVSSVGDSFIEIRKKIISNIKKLNLKGSFFRRDIGWKVIDKNENY